MNLIQDNCRSKQLAILKDSIYFSGTISLTQHFCVTSSLEKMLKRVSEIIFLSSYLQLSEVHIFIDNYRLLILYLFFLKILGRVLFKEDSKPLLKWNTCFWKPAIFGYDSGFVFFLKNGDFSFISTVGWHSCHTYKNRLPNFLSWSTVKMFTMVLVKLFGSGQ